MPSVFADRREEVFESGRERKRFLAASPSLPRKAYGTALACHCRPPLNLVQRWLGHTHRTTAIYAAACGREERAFAARLRREAI